MEKLQTWLNNWSVTSHHAPPDMHAQYDNFVKRSASKKADFKKPGKDGMNIFRAVMITGPPGIGKTTSAHLCAKLAGYTPIEFNASDARSKKLIEVIKYRSAPEAILFICSLFCRIASTLRTSPSTVGWRVIMWVSCTFIRNRILRRVALP